MLTYILTRLAKTVKGLHFVLTEKRMVRPV